MSKGFVLSSEPPKFKETPLGPLPEDWEVVSFVDSIGDQKFSVGKVQRQHYKSAGRFPIIDQGQSPIAGYWDDPRDVYQGPLPVIVFGDHTRVFKFVEFEFVCGADGTKVLLPNTNKFDPEFLFFTFLNLDIPSRGYNRHFHLLKEQYVPLPPLPEQRAMAYVLRTVQRAKEATEKVIQAMRELKKSLMRHLFTYGPVPIKEAERVTLKETEIGLIPEHWQVVKLGEVAKIAVGGSAPQGSQYFGGPYPFIRVQHLNVNSENITRWDYITDEAIRKYKLKLFPKGTIVFPKSGASIRLEKRAILPVDAYLVSHLCAVIPREDIADSYFILYILRTIKLAEQKAEGYPTLKLTEITNIPIPLPPLSEQHEIARILQAVDQKIQAEERRKQALEVLFKTLLSHLMTGKIRVNHLKLSNEEEIS
ncbi:MAG: restriction endonuclease subunit S [Caldiserica bacterium]|jgi:type I restriction enzyme S subunit|nr:restriction endonuclease subunit S [Caldisericota bacterium]MDH7562527.1 restriction endonuclease subunit S [Caldisericota bacterium]